MIGVKFFDNKHQSNTPIRFDNFKGVNCVDINPADGQVPYALNTDFGRMLGTASKRYGKESLITSLGSGGCKGCHTFKSSAGDIPLIAWGTDVYKLGGSSDSTVTKTTTADFSAGTLVDVVAWNNQLFLAVDTSKEQANITTSGPGMDLTLDTTHPLGQTFTTGANMRYLSAISIYNTGTWSTGENITLTLYESTSKATNMGSKTINGAQSNGYVKFSFSSPITVSSSTQYYFEMTINTGNIDLDCSTTYAGGTAYSGGVDQGRDLVFIVYENGFKSTGTYTSQSLDLTTAPTVNALSWNVGGTVAFTVKGSSDNSVWGDWQTISSSGDGIPLTRYIEVETTLTATSDFVGASISDYTITYSSGYGTATSIKSSLSGNTVRFTDWDDRVWFTDGGHPQVWNGTTCRDVGVAIPATAPTIEGSGTGSITGAYKAKVTFVNSDNSESNACASEGTCTASSALQINWSSIPTRTGCTRKLYRTKAGGTTYYYVATIADDTTTTYTDTASDAVVEAGDVLSTDNNVPPHATIIHAHKNYMFYVDSSAPSRLYVSDVAKPENIPSASYFQFPETILGVASYGDYLVVSGKRFTHYSGGSIWNVDPSVGDWDWKDIGMIGCVSQDAMVECLDATSNMILVIPLETGLKFLSGNLLGNDLLATPLSRNVQPYFDQAISKETMSAVYYNQAYYIAFNWAEPGATAVTHNNVVFKLDLRNREWSGPWAMDISGFFVANNELYMTSSTAGKVFKHAGNTDEGSAIDMVLTAQNIGASYAKRRFLKAIFSVLRGCTTTNTTLKVKYDSSNRTITLGDSTNWRGQGGTALTAHDIAVSPPKSISGGRANFLAWEFEDNTTNDMVLFDVTIMAEPAS